MNRARLLLLGVGVGLAVSGASLAETAYTTKSVNLRAGPSRNYELVAQAPGGVPVEVYGCVDDWTWCDVGLGNDRGWMYAGNLVYPYRGRRVVILGNGPLFGFPIVTFSVGPYWDTYYRGRPWYSRRSYWYRRPPPAHWYRPPVSHPPGYRPPAVQPPRPAVDRPPVYRPQPQQPQPRPPHSGRPEVAKPQPQPRPPHSGRPEVAKPQPQPVRPAPAKPPDKGKPQHRDERKPG
jgi:uncharacterized protein YraI